MKKISQNMLFNRYFVLLAASIFAMFSLLIFDAPFSLIVAVVAFLGVFLVCTINRLLYADEVFDCGDQLVIKKRGKKINIKLSDISEVSSTIMQPAGITLHLKSQSVLGKKIRFMPNVFFTEFKSFTKILNDRIG